MGLRAPARWGFAALLAITALTGCKESETRPVKNAVSLEFAPCLGSGPVAEGDAGSGETSLCRARLDDEAPEGDVNACVLLRDADLPDKVYRVALRWANGTATSVNDPLIDIAPGKTIEGEFYLLRTGGSASLCDGVQFGQACGEGCVLRLIQPATLLGQDATALDFKSGGQCTTEWGPAAEGASLPYETCNAQDDDCDGKSDEGLFCDGDCQSDDNCAERPGTPVCDTGSGRCVRCLPGTHAGCGADELCCDGAGERSCRPTAPGGECETCGVACGVGADACQDRSCVCGAGGVACGGNTPLCVGGTCVACDDHDDCGRNNLCCNGACIPTSLEGCTDCGSGCAVGTATVCQDRACKCGGFNACTDPAGLCLTEGQARCAECEVDERCTFDVGRTQCVNDLCRQCDTADSAGCAEASVTPICGAANTCLRCQNNGQCQLRPGSLDFCLADGACHQCEPDLNNTLGTDNGCTPLSPFCDAGACRQCQGDAECPGLCVDGQCAGCDPDTNAGCPAEAPICNVNRICEACSRDDAGDGTRIGDLDCNKGLPEGSPPRLCTVEQTCEICDMGENHRGCGLDNLCCVGAGGVPNCQPTEFLGANGCETCGTACDPDISNGCSDRQCLCDVAGEACGGGQLCVANTGACQNCRDNADCPLDSQCCLGLCVGTGPTAANVCTGCNTGADSCNELGSSLCNDRVCECGNNAACGGAQPVCDDVLANGLPNPNVNLHTCVACLVDGHCTGQGTGIQCVNKNCVECDADPLSYDGCGERSAEPICVNGNCRGCASSLDCQVRPGNLDQCNNGNCVECLVVAPGEAAPGCNIGAPICQNNVCRPCAASAECGVGRECVGGSCESCDPNGDIGCDGTQPICDDNSLRCRACAADNECPNGSICTPGDGRCVTCDLASNRGCNNNQLCCGALPGQTCVALDNNRCTSCNNGACDVNTANRCSPRSGDNTVGSCDCGAQDSCSGNLAFCDGSAPTGGCVGCRADGDCSVPGLTQCVTNGPPVSGADPALCRACDPDVAGNLSGCDYSGNQPFCHRVGNIPNQQVSCLACASDAECTGHPSGSQCVATGACRLCDPANGANSAGCILSSAAPYCGNNSTCRGCGSDAECAATAGNGNLCHEAANGGNGACFACNDGAKNGTETGLDCGGPDCPNKCGTGLGCTNAGRDCISGVCTGGTCRAPLCTDTVRNGTETDVDCGGATCRGLNRLCANNAACAAAGDCVSGVCTGNICVAPTCNDGVKNGTETAIDCGGGSCPRCGTGLACVNNQGARDCESFVCTGNICRAATCVDTVRNGAETATDCGGGTCPTCANGLACVNGARDCVSGVCPANNLCAVPTCVDGVRNASETGLDCGGGTCPTCPAGQACVNGQGVRDCQSANCVAGLCVQAGCNDGIRNNGETDTDCGGPCGATCQTGDDCAFGDRDCANKRCIAAVCVAPVCAIGANPGDLVRNGTETDLDCGGGGGCNPCAAGLACVNNQGARDCAGQGLCTNNVCQAPTCSDGVRNGTETGTDCGGGTCSTCATGQGCVDGQDVRDCQSKVCSPGGICQAPACNDGVKNGNETDLDCGGVCGKTCDPGEICGGDGDCVRYCNGGICAPCRKDTRLGCQASEVCCVNAGNYTCRGATVDNSIGCLSCGVGCEVDRADNCSNNACRCGGNAQCGAGLFCVSGACVTCRVNSDCGGGTPACVGGTCQVCNASDDFGCAGGTPQCKNGTSCVECLANGDCTSDQTEPTCVSNVCRRCDTADDDGCSNPTPQCDALSSCVECLANGDCAAPDEAFCAPNGDNAKTCVECLIPANCNADKANACTDNSCRCGANAPCGGSLHCNAGACVACIVDGDCPAGDACDNNVCVDCKNGNNVQCANPNPVCVGTSCALCDTADNDGCVGGTPVCLNGTSCVLCDDADDEGCGGATPACLNNTSCVACTANADCTGADTKCKTDTHTCVACLVDGDCPANNTCPANICVPN